jgi:hypothetical protein
MAYNNDRPYQSTYLYEQVLIQKKIPFDIIFDEQLKDLSRYKVLILADQECLSNDKLDLVRKFVQDGGGLIVTEFTSLYTEWRERKREFGLKDLIQLDAPEWNGRPFPESIINTPIIRKESGKGRVVYIPEVKPSIPKPTASPMTSRYWKLPVNSADLTDAVKWAAGNNLTIEVNAPETVTAELVKSGKQDKLILHLVNYDVAKTATVNNINVKLRLDAGKQVRDMKILSPDHQETISLKYEVKEGSVIFTVPVLNTYDLVVIELS